MKQGSRWFIALTTLLCVAATSARTPEDVEQLCPPPPQDVSEGSREWQRDRVCRSYLDMEDELGIDFDARQQVIDALTDRQRAQNHGPTTDTVEQRLRREADSLTSMLTRVRAAIGDERMEAFYVYMNSDRERFLLSSFTRQLSLDAQLTADQKAQLKVLLSRHVAQSNAYEPSPLWAPEKLHDMPEEDVRMIDVVNDVARWQLGHVKTMELDAQLETRAAEFLTARQLETLQRVNQRSRRESVKYLMRHWTTIDASKLPELQQRVAVRPRQQTPIPAQGDIEVEYSIAIDDRNPLIGRRTLANGAPLTLDADELRLELIPSLYRPSLFKSYSRAELHVFTKVAGEWRKLEQPSRSIRQENAFAMVAGVRRGYFIESTLRVSD